MKIFPSLASADQLKLREEIEKLKNHTYLHYDIEDGNFVPNITFGLGTVRLAAEVTEASMDAHLMVQNPLDYLNDLQACGFKAVAVHWEALDYPSRIITEIKRRGMKAGIALNPCTAVNEVEFYLNEADYFLIMTSEPDGAGEKFRADMVEKVRWLAKRCRTDQDIIADGGISGKEIRLLRKNGATGAVIGRAVFQAEDSFGAITYFENL